MSEPDMYQWLEFISRQVRQEREQSGLTQEQLDIKADLPDGFISRLENGAISPSNLVRLKIAKALGIDSSCLEWQS